jgi:hypothetical protein
MSYVEFSYNNSYQESMKMALFEMLYGRRCQTPLFWNESGEKRFSDPIYCKKPRSKFAWLGRTSESRNQNKRATLIIGGEN